MGIIDKNAKTWLNKIGDIMLEKILNNQLFKSAVVLVIAFIIYYAFKMLIDRYINKYKLSKKKQTYLKLLRSIIKYLILILFILIVLYINGIDVKSLIAGLGIVSLIGGLALQDALKDIIQGFNLVMDDYFSVGDIICINNSTYKVIELGIKCVKLKNLENNSYETISNRNITVSCHKTNMLDINIPLPYEEDYENIKKIIEKKIIPKIENLDKVNNVSFKGIQEFGDSAIFYKIRMDVNPEEQYQTKRDANVIIKQILDKEKVSIPYTQIDVHNK